MSDKNCHINNEAQPSNISEAPKSCKPGVYIRTYGCQMNEYDSKKLLKILDSNFDEVDSPDNASLMILNTCSVRDKPEQKLYSVLGELQELKKEILT